MGRKVDSTYYSHINLSLDDINQTYEKTMSAIDVKYSKEKNKGYGATFFAYNEQDIRKERETLVSEIEKEMSFACVACVEAYLRMDFKNRCELKKSDELSKLYLKVYKPTKRPYEYNFTDLILHGWRDTYLVENVRLTNQIEEIYVVYRHWLAHGRYWRLKQPIQKYDYTSVYCVLKEFINTIKSELVEVNPEDILFKKKEE